jgi:hypothetical protein
MYQNIDQLVANTVKPNYAAFGYKIQNERSRSPLKKTQSASSAKRSMGPSQIQIAEPAIGESFQEQLN